MQVTEISHLTGSYIEGNALLYVPGKLRADAGLGQRSLQQLSDVPREAVCLCCTVLRYQLHPNTACFYRLKIAANSFGGQMLLYSHPIRNDYV